MTTATAAFDPNRKTDFKVYVSRIPKHWTTKLMHEHFISLSFGEVAGVELFMSKRVRKDSEKRGIGKICYAFKNEGKCDKGDSCLFSHILDSADAGGDDEGEGGQSLGSGCVYFYDQDAVDNALNQSSLHISRRIIKISPFESVDDGRDLSICYAWKNFQCTHGSTCKFSHEGPGAEQKVGTRFQGRKFQCLSFKTKGKCSKGDSCKFLHTADVEKIKEKKREREIPMAAAGGGGSGDDINEDEDRNKNEGGKEEDNTDTKAKGVGNGDKAKQLGLCRLWKKKGKCRNGDKCMFSHTSSNADDSQSKKQQNGVINSISSDIVLGIESKRKRIDGSVLVQQRKMNKIYFKDD